jgi:plasmid stabilization system protein ParE
VSRPLVLRAEAIADIRHAYIYLEAVRAGLGHHFLRRLGDLLERIESMPEMYGVIWQDVRAARLKRFRFLVYYVQISDRIEVLAVLHAARDSSPWQSRL